MEEHAVPVGNLVFPVLLPFAQCRLLQESVRLDDQLWCGSLEAHTALDADDGVADVAVAADGIAGADLLNFLNGFHLVVEMLAVDGVYLTLLEGDTQLGFRLLGSDMLQIRTLGQPLCRVKELATADARAPDADIWIFFRI